MHGKNHALLAFAGYSVVAARWPDSPVLPRLDPGFFSHPVVAPMAAPEAADARLGIALGAGAFVAVVGSLLPDLDAEHSMLLSGGWLGFGLLFRILGFFTRLLSPHRGPLHSVLFAALVTVATEYGVRSASGHTVSGIGWTLGAAYLSHLLLDAGSVSGVALFWPLPLVVRLWPNYRVGSAAEHLLAWAGAIGLFALSFAK